MAAFQVLSDAKLRAGMVVGLKSDNNHHTVHTVLLLETRTCAWISDRHRDGR